MNKVDEKGNFSCAINVSFLESFCTRTLNDKERRCVMVHLPRRTVWPFSLGIMLLLLLSGCGSNELHNSATSPSSSSASQTTGAGSPGSIPAHTPQATVPGSTPSPSAGPVVLQVSATTYRSGETISVTIWNQGKQTISFPDHLTNCTVLLFEHQAGSAWQPVAPCKLMTATRLHFLTAGTTLAVTLTSSLAWPGGIYRAKLSYSELGTVGNANVDIGPARTVYSSEFRLLVGNASQ